ncbi:MAG: hypothetical protein O3C10_07320 [Chloroflexi bacterium]|nr:hypothetical protein [Chloroflexota bacterium]
MSIPTPTWSRKLGMYSVHSSDDRLNPLDFFGLLLSSAGDVDPPGGALWMGLFKGGTDFQAEVMWGRVPVIRRGYTG